MIENFAELSEQEQRKFAEALVNKINSENTFIDYVDFEISDVDGYDISGGLVIALECDDLVDVSREATWTCADEDEVNYDPGYEADYTNTLRNDVKEAFKTLSAVIDGYKVSLVIDDVDEEETVEVEVDSYSKEDAGIGSYDYWGHTGYDSQPYVEVEGTIIKACSCALSLYVDPVDEPAVEPEVEEF